MEALEVYLRLINQKNIGYGTIKKLVKTFGSLKNIDLKISNTVLGSKRTELIKLALRKTDEKVKEILKLIEKGEFKAITLEDENYPERLKAIDNPPPILFYKGSIEVNGIGIVGTRNPSEKSLSFVEKLVKKKKKNVISGGAKGIDFKAHKEALNNGLKTFVILGCGILKTPKYILDLHEEFGATLISEFLPFQEGSKYTFPKRNRLISALSDEVYIIEAGEKSGALITANYAIEYKVPLYAYVGSKNSERWKGCIKLIEKGFAREINIEDKNSNLEELLKTPKTFDELLLLTNMNRSELLKELNMLIIKGKVKQEGAYYLKV